MLDKDIKNYLDANLDDTKYNLDSKYISWENHEKQYVEKSDIIVGFLSSYNRFFLNFDYYFDLARKQSKDRKGFYGILLGYTFEDSDFDLQLS